jgi:hypothetical protein
MCASMGHPPPRLWDHRSLGRGVLRHPDPPAGQFVPAIATAYSLIAQSQHGSA